MKETDKDKNKKSEKDEELYGKKKHGSFSFFSGLILIIIAVAIVLAKNGANIFGSSDTPDDIFVDAHMGIWDEINEEVLDYLSYCGTCARANDGHLISETEIDTEKQLEADDSSLIGSLIGAIGLNKVTLTEGYSLKNEDGLITLTRESDEETVYSNETILYGFDFSGLGKTSALKEKTIKKLLAKYEKMFVEELLADGYTYERDAIVNLDTVLLAESSYTFDYSKSDIVNALDTVLDGIRSDRKWLKAYEAMSDGDYTEYMEKLKERLKGAESLLQTVNSISGTIYVKSDGELNYAELTFDVDDEKAEEIIAERLGGILSEAVDIDPVFTVSIGYTANGDDRGFRFSVISAEGVTRVDVTGHGTLNKTGFFDGTVSGFTGTATFTYSDMSGDITLTDAQIIEMDKGIRIGGTYILTLDRIGVVVETDATNEEQEISYTVSLAGKNYMSGQINFKDK